MVIFEPLFIFLKVIFEIILLMAQYVKTSIDRRVGKKNYLSRNERTFSWRMGNLRMLKKWNRTKARCPVTMDWSAGLSS